MGIKLIGRNGMVETMPGVDVDMDVIARVAAKAALEVKGVLALENAYADGIAAALGREGRTRGARVVAGDDGCSLHIGAVVEYGVNIPDVAWNLQDHIKKTVEYVIGARVNQVNVLIAGVRDEAAAKGGAGNGAASGAANSAVSGAGNNAVSGAGNNAVSGAVNSAVSGAGNNAANGAAGDGAGGRTP